MQRVNLIIIFCAIFVFAFLIINFSVYGQKDSSQIYELIVFYSPTCHKCSEVKNKVIPEIERQFKDKVQIEYKDISDIQNYKLLLGLQEKQGLKLKNTLPVFYLEGNFLEGKDITNKRAMQFIARVLNGINIPLGQKIASVDLLKHFKGFEPLVIVSAGLIDGINPCAFTVIVFFISFLALQGYRKRELIIIGLCFIFAVFLTYLLIGLGLFNFLYRLRGFWILVKIFNFLVGIFSIILGLLCLYDFFKFKKTQKTEELVLQLPQSIKNQIHKIIGWHYRKPEERMPDKSQKKHTLKLLMSALFIGFLVSILEAVCTGQIYLPTIAFVLKTTHLKLEALGYLLLYNLMFIVPLLVIFLFALLGVTSQAFSKFLRRRLLSVKILMAVLFFSLGIFLLWRP